MILCQIELTNYCNFKCNGCLRFSSKRQLGMMSLDVFEKSIELCQKMHVQEIWLQNWGEPLLHPDIISFVKMASKKNKVGFITNGSLLNYPLLDSLKKAGLSKLNISINQSTPVKFTLYLFEMYKFANKINIDCWLRSVIFNRQEFNYLFRLLKNKKVKWQRGMIRNKTKIRAYDCPIIDKNFIIYWDGLVVPCCQIVDAEIDYCHILHTSNPIEQINNGIKYIHNRLKQNKPHIACKHCFEVDYKMPIIYKLKGKKAV